MKAALLPLCQTSFHLACLGTVAVVAVRALKRNPPALVVASATAAVPGCVENHSLLEKSHSDSAPHAGPGPGGLEKQLPNSNCFGKYWGVQCASIVRSFLPSLSYRGSSSAKQSGDEACSVAFYIVLLDLTVKSF